MRLLKFLFIMPVIALLDPLLLIWIWPRVSQMVMIFGLVILPLLVTLVARRKPSPDQSPFAGYIRTIARIMAWYPGPLSKTLAILLLIPAVERALLRKVMATMLGNFAGIHQGMANATKPATPPGAGGKFPKSATVERDENGLKRAQGRVID